MSTGTSLVPYEPAVDPIMVNQMQRLVANISSMTERLTRIHDDPRRDMNAECGYPETASITAEQYRNQYDRNPVACRVVQVMPLESWKNQPEIWDNDDEEVNSPFEQAVLELAKRLRGTSFFKGKEGNPIWEILRRACILARIGHFGVLLIGFDDGKDLKEPVQGFEKGLPDKPVKGVKPLGVMYLRAFDESLIEVFNYEDDPNNPRFGQPKTYTLTFNDPKEGTTGTGVGLTTATKEVHWSRVIHIVDNKGSSEVIGVPAMRPVYNNCLDCSKVYGSSAEGYWKANFPILSFETHPQLGGDVTVDKEGVRAAYERMMNTLQRVMITEGMNLNSIAPAVADPASYIDVQVTAICVQLAMPKRVFMGSERGELASDQDDDTWGDRVADYQIYHNTNNVICPFFDRLILAGALPVPEDEGYNVGWPDLQALNETEQADLAVKQTQAITTYVQGDGETLVTPLDYMVEFLKIPKDRAEAMLKNTLERMEDEDAGKGGELRTRVGGVTGLVELFRARAEGVLDDQSLLEAVMMFYKLTEDGAGELISKLPEMAIKMQDAKVEAEKTKALPPPMAGGKPGFPPKGQPKPGKAPKKPPVANKKKDKKRDKSGSKLRSKKRVSSGPTRRSPRG